MPKVSEAHVEARMQQILQAASACFARQGFHKTTMQDICAEAGLSPGAVYRYFPSKEEIIEAMVAERRREGFNLIQAALQMPDSASTLNKLTEIFFSEIDDVQGCAVDVELWGEAFRNPRIHSALGADLDAVRGAFTAIVGTAQERGDINPAVKADSVAQIMVSLFHGMVIQKSLDPAIDTAAYVEALRAMMTGRFWTGPLPEGEA
jgi:AcrR family transcriptional regulator